ncbi:hypothetical protein [Phenylobacterium sp.]|uniref:hypothetical protein n=1 Tax=Phenylobacterium sp. TaxID=1871053 RepID=UPI00273156AA|nr:hypothetical protein [Phenylobacterium sp.]MDP1873861.1 hypothetical protein [Phenylobacterium sp.]MDP3298619.1 hypothetical protein [Phenylobacterium sp.]MDP3490757.1 hypothetical protein [Phenylobacterium sp.]
MLSAPFVSSITVLALAAMSLALARRVPAGAKLPMQWGFKGLPNWSAPREIALSFTPLLAAFTLTPFTLASLWVEPDERLTFRIVLALVCLGFIVAHALHLYLLARWLRAQDGR